MTATSQYAEGRYLRRAGGEHLKESDAPYKKKCLELVPRRPLSAYGHPDFAAYVLDPEFIGHDQASNAAM